MIAGIVLCFVAIGISLGALFYGHGSVFLILMLLPALGLLLGMVSVAYARIDFDTDEQSFDG